MVDLERSIDVYVTGVPAPQGSMVAHVVKRKDGTRFATVHYPQGTPLHKWRADVAIAVRHEWGDDMTYHPVRMVLVFYFPRPLRHMTLQGTIKPQYANVPHDGRPDLDKLVRAVLDALTDVVYPDDAQVHVIRASKRYVYDHQLPGLQIILYALP